MRAVCPRAEEWQSGCDRLAGCFVHAVARRIGLVARLLWMNKDWLFVLGGGKTRAQSCHFVICGLLFVRLKFQSALGLALHLVLVAGSVQIGGMAACL